MIRAILADDHAMFRQGLASMLEGSGNIELLARAVDGVEAFKFIQEFKPDIAILDITMPGETGIEVAEKIRDSGLSTRVILLTTHDDASLAVQGQEVGAVGHVLKENAFEDILEAVKIVNGGGMFLSPCMARDVEELKSLSNSAPLSPRERLVLQKLSSGLTSEEIANVLNLTPKTVENHLTHLMDKFGIRTQIELIQYTHKNNMASSSLFTPLGLT